MKARAIANPPSTGEIELLVEDELTRVVLTQCWSQHPTAKLITVRAMAGHLSVERGVQAARESGRAKVYGLVDRDFGALPLDPWKGPLFKTEHHEIENQLLDFAALAAAQEKLDASVLQARAQSVAASMVHWMALRHTMTALLEALPTAPPHPHREQIKDPEEARLWLSRQSFPRSLEDAIRTRWTKSYLLQQLAHYGEGYKADLNEGRWLQTFAGKEIFANLCKLPGWPTTNITPEDLARLVVKRWQRTGIPPFFSSLANALFRAA